jgi:hypothetical protein
LNFDLGNIDKMLNAIPYPISTSQLIQLAKDRGAPGPVVGMLEKLPDKTFNSAQEIKDMMSGSLGGLGKVFKH